ncbi:MAG: hypothetical protein C4326_09895 [Ignavibacteria bacterium]
MKSLLRCFGVLMDRCSSDASEGRCSSNTDHFKTIIPRNARDALDAGSLRWMNLPARALMMQ